MRSLIESQIRRSIETKELLLQRELSAVEQAGLLIASALEAGGRLLICGNGGSAADAQHLAAELLIRYKSGNDRPALPAISLSADSSTLTAASNDFGFEQVFARQVEGLGKNGDILLGITTSGNSPNILEALRQAKKRDLHTILLTGGDGGAILRDHSGLVDVAVRVPSSETARIQESHILIIHIFCAVVEKKLFSLE